MSFDHCPSCGSELGRTDPRCINPMCKSNLPIIIGAGDDSPAEMSNWELTKMVRDLQKRVSYLESQPTPPINHCAMLPGDN